MMGSVLAWAVPGEYEVEVCMELDDGSLTEWRPGRCGVDEDHQIRLLTTHGWQLDRTTQIRRWRVQGVPLAATFPSPLMLAKHDTITLKPS